MVNEELITNITARFQQGEKAAAIKDALFNEGWSEGDIDAAFAHIRHTAYMQIPIYAKIHHWMDSVDKQTAELPTKTVIQIFGAIGLIFLGIVIALYFFLDPFGFRTSQRDKEREDATIAIRQSLDKYHQDNNVYPSTLKELVPTYLAKEHVDPRTKKAYEYKALDGRANYEFCIEFELQTIRCVSTDTTSDIPIVAPEPTAEPIIATFAINGQVFLDVDGSGEKESEEVGQQDVDVLVTGSNKEIVCATATDTSGIFNCNVDGQGEYTVEVKVPKGFTAPMGDTIQVKLPSTTSPQPNIQTLFIGLVK